MPEEIEQSRGSGGLLDHDGIAAEKRIQEDLRTVARAVRKGWDVPLALRESIKQRIATIMEKETVTVMTAEGLVSVDGPADANAIRAAAVVVSMTGQDQADDHLEDKNNRMDAGKPTEVLAGVDFTVPGLPTKSD
jgi:hypothetical protein